MRVLPNWIVVFVLTAVSLGAHALDRQAFTFTSYKLSASLDVAKQGFSVTGTLQARNDSPAAQKDLAMQISSSLRWTSVSIGNEQIPWVQQSYTTDIDHTGQVSEAILTLPNPVAPGASVTVTFSYDGAITLNTGRLLRVDTPGTYAARTDWDQISDSLTAVRGLGYVVWYPVALNAASLSDGMAVWDEIANWKQRHANSTLEVAFTVPEGKTLVANTEDSKTNGNTQEVVFHSLAEITPTFTVAAYQVLDRPALTIYHLPEHTQIARDYVLSAEKVLPQITEYFGTPKHKLVIVDLPNDELLPFDDGEPFYFTPLLKLDPRVTDILMGHQLVHCIVFSPRPWISEGLAHYAQLLVLERESGREAALSYLNQFRESLVEAEKANSEDYPGKGAPLVSSNDQILFRSKSMYVWYMLRDMVGEKALSEAIHNYNSGQDTQPAYMQSLIQAQAPTQSHLEQFFDDWVYRDKGLPDLKIEAVYPRATLSSSIYLVTITAVNSGEASVPLIVGVMSDKGERREKGFIAGQGKTVIRVPYPGTPGKVWVNDGSVPESDISNNTFEIKNLPANPQP
ncbi:MAG TPA: hypothetical protein VF135_01885 [Terriglobales bacterium]